MRSTSVSPNLRLARRHLMMERARWLSKLIAHHIRGNDLGHLVRTILVNDMAATGEHLHLELAYLRYSRELNKGIGRT